MVEPTPPAKPPDEGKLGRVLIPTGAFVVALLLGFGAAKVQDGQQQELEQAKHEKSLNAAEELRASEHAAHNTTKAKLSVMKGYRLLHLAIFSIEERNFGIAEKHAKEASKVLASVDAKDIQKRVAPIAKALKSFELEVSDDVGAQRKALMELSEKLDVVIAAF